MATYNKTKSGAYDVEQLEKEINENSVIVPALQHITADGEDLILEFTASLSEPEDTELNAVISDHVPTPQVIDVVQLPFSDIDSKKLAVHPTYKPRLDGSATYAVWTGAGDEVDGNGDIVPDGEIGAGPMLHFDLTDQINHQGIEVKFDHTASGRVWLHEAYIKFENAPSKAYIEGCIHAYPTALQQVSDLDLEITNNFVHLAAGGPGTGTHGFAGTPVLLPRTFSLSGDWDYDPVNGLTPNTGNGAYAISDIEQPVHRYVNRVPCFGTSPFFSITSDETTELKEGYFLKICCKTTDGSNFASAWNADVFLEVYRERTYSP